LRVVLDTNTALSTLLFESGRLSWIREGWTAGHFVPLCSLATCEELIRVLAYPKFRLEDEDIRVIVREYIRFAEVIHVLPDDLERLPQCRDPDDQMFLELTMCGNADVLVTGDDDLLALADNCEFAIEAPSKFKIRFE